MTTEALPDSLVGLEFDIPCASKDCTSPAVMFLQLSHTSDNGCMWSGGAFRCQAHYESRRDAHARWLTLAKICAKCSMPVGGTLEQNIRITPL